MYIKDLAVNATYGDCAGQTLKACGETSYCRVPSCIYLSMPYCPGGTLACKPTICDSPTICLPPTSCGPISCYFHTCHAPTVDASPRGEAGCRQDTLCQPATCLADSRIEVSSGTIEDLDTLKRQLQIAIIQVEDHEKRIEESVTVESLKQSLEKLSKDMKKIERKIQELGG